MQINKKGLPLREGLFCSTFTATVLRQQLNGDLPGGVAPGLVLRALGGKVNGKHIERVYIKALVFCQYFKGI